MEPESLDTRFLRAFFKCPFQNGVNVLSENPGGEENNLKVEDGGLKVPIPEPVEDDSQKIQGGNGQGKSGSHPLDEFLKGFEGALF